MTIQTRYKNTLGILSLPLVQIDGTAGTATVANGTVTLALTGAPQYLALAPRK